jgi:hypothetical protein
MQRPWGIHTNRVESSIEQGKVRKQTDVPLQKIGEVRIMMYDDI